MCCPDRNGSGWNQWNSFAGKIKTDSRNCTNEETCVVYGMPKAIYEAGVVDEVVPLDEVAQTITKNVGVK